jgi:hypothetical protein
MSLYDIQKSFIIILIDCGSGSGTGSTQPREDNWGATWMEK